jgi:alanyl-tRNA synthetase
LFGEKYGDVVRMVQVPGFSAELCGGTHVANTGDIRLFKITSESAVATGTRRIEAVTRQGAIDWYSKRADLVDRMAHTLKTAPDALEDRVQKLLSNERELERKIDELKKKLASGSTGSAIIKGLYQGKPLEIHLLDDADAGFLRSKGDALRKANPQGVSLAVSGQLVLVTVEPDATGLHAGQILKDMGQRLPAKGGGQAQTAQGQFTRPVSQSELEIWAKG